MTSCLLVKSRKRLVAVSDGRLSRDDGTSTFNSTRKLIEFPISYKIPRFSSGRFDGYSEYRSFPWFVAYAGTHTVTTEIIDLFRQRIGNLVLTRETPGRVPALADHFDTSARFDDDYNFSQGETPKVAARDICQELRVAFETRGSEFSETRRERPDSQYILFGNEEATGEYKAFVLSADENGYFPGARLRINVEHVIDGALATIGSPTVSASAHQDCELRNGLVCWQADEEPDARLFDFDKLEQDAVATPDGPNDAWGIRRVALRFCQIISSTSDASVGGQMMVAQGGWEMEIRVQTVDPPGGGHTAP
jgi:hypothetical protein